MRTCLFLVCLCWASCLWAQSAALGDLALYDSGSTTGAVTTVDVVQGSCGIEDKNSDGDTTDPGEVTVEPFFDTLGSIQIKNNSLSTLSIVRIRATVTGVGKGAKLAPIGGSLIGPNTTAPAYFYLFAARNGLKRLGNKVVRPKKSFSTLKLEVDVVTAAGKRFTLRKSSALSLSDVDKCAAS